MTKTIRAKELTIQQISALRGFAGEHSDIGIAIRCALDSSANASAVAAAREQVAAWVNGLAMHREHLNDNGLAILRSFEAA